jgi:hypothetical protein
VVPVLIVEAPDQPEAAAPPADQAPIAEPAPEKVSPWLRLYSVSLSMFLASLGTVAVFALFLHGDFLDAAMDAVAAFLRPRPALQAFLACTPLLAAILLGFGSSRKVRRRRKAEETTQLRKEAGLE